ncbi:MAG: cob(I)yrinic acid a,c-diamide adenosyltransferase [Candidatus Paceibacterota bacterium]|jgi:cob(I)alamin adenosyltransferase
MLYTRKGDDGTTKMFDSSSGQRVSKNSSRSEALGCLDEFNSFLGILKVKSKDQKLKLGDKNLEEVINWVQNCLFTVQAEVAGSEKKIGEDAVMRLESLIDEAEKELPPIKTFFISGGTELAAMADYSRTLARTAERRVVGLREGGDVVIGDHTLAFMNRSSSLFYVVARLINHKSGINEHAPSY